ncbi:CDP-diacylglycerol--glycerol-3-phosphate 3-phosphatidyltransferase [Candidatus Nitrotoga fabula]|uniref:CDP-diacylglycerol--glycerol-3-phosphate 3-phosphatidyltransferase n=1 Tax=Candidatus Nitrotoga fabula TaxID=2182327 RepID=A0A2X0QVA3_9PROT|nr:CDP-diacylglycerol--glycerol-3-phosphate 3-phosphatidyltransferase [Candidatus Nitrotoga fabula]CAE6735995.1 phosphatidylglycerophosphate synthase [Candidatus Nitrotoga fabula]SPS06059.1 phosphatidylglycerophosphate synthetase [Candidatus Nitrotoga fabula]
MPFNIPNLLTWFRIILIPVFLAVFYLPDAVLTLHQKHLVSTVIFALAAFTDWLDGYLARALDQTSAFGAFLDPVADKLMVAAALVVLVQLGYVDMVIAFIIIGREIAISALREWMAQVGESRSTAVSLLGKAKTMFQMVAILLLLLHDSIAGLPSASLGTLLIYLAAFLTLWSMVYYLRLALPQITGKSCE